MSDYLFIFIDLLILIYMYVFPLPSLILSNRQKQPHFLALFYCTMFVTFFHNCNLFPILTTNLNRLSAHDTNSTYLRKLYLLSNACLESCIVIVNNIARYIKCLISRLCSIITYTQGIILRLGSIITYNQGITVTTIAAALPTVHLPHHFHFHLHPHHCTTDLKNVYIYLQATIWVFFSAIQRIIQVISLQLKSIFNYICLEQYNHTLTVSLQIYYTIDRGS